MYFKAFLFFVNSVNRKKGKKKISDRLQTDAEKMFYPLFTGPVYKPVTKNEGEMRLFNRIPKPAEKEEKRADPVRMYPKMVLSVDELADEFGISRPTAYRLAKEKGFPAFTIGQRIFINREGLQRWIDEQCNPQPAA